MTDIDHTYEQELADIIRDTLTRIADVSRRMGDSYRDMEKDVSATRNQCSKEISEMEHQLDRAQEKADIAQRRELSLVDENQRLREECARLRGEMQIVSDTAHRASIGSQIDRRLSQGHPAFSDAVQPPNERLGAPYRSVVKDVAESARILEAMEREMPHVEVTPEARLLAGGL